MNPDPLYMGMKNMSQRQHGPRPYDGILGASQEKVVAYEGDDAGTPDAAIQQFTDWIRESGSYAEGDEGTLIEIRVIGKFKLTGSNEVTLELSDYATPTLAQS